MRPYVFVVNATAVCLFTLSSACAPSERLDFAAQAVGSGCGRWVDGIDFGSGPLAVSEFHTLVAQDTFPDRGYDFGYQTLAYPAGAPVEVPMMRKRCKLPSCACAGVILLNQTDAYGRGYLVTGQMIEYGGVAAVLGRTTHVAGAPAQYFYHVDLQAGMSTPVPMPAGSGPHCNGMLIDPRLSADTILKTAFITAGACLPGDSGTTSHVKLTYAPFFGAAPLGPSTIEAF